MKSLFAILALVAMALPSAGGATAAADTTVIRERSVTRSVPVQAVSLRGRLSARRDSRHSQTTTQRANGPTGDCDGGDCVVKNDSEGDGETKSSGSSLARCPRCGVVFPIYQPYPHYPFHGPNQVTERPTRQRTFTRQRSILRRRGAAVVTPTDPAAPSSKSSEDDLTPLDPKRPDGMKSKDEAPQVPGTEKKETTAKPSSTREAADYKRATHKTLKCNCAETGVCVCGDDCKCKNCPLHAKPNKGA